MIRLEDNRRALIRDAAKAGKHYGGEADLIFVLFQS